MNGNTLSVRLRESFNLFSPTERKVARVLLQQYPIAGLETVAQLAQRASVSGPTVLRLINKLGFDSYSSFQESLRSELDAQLQSPILRRNPNQVRAQGQGFLADFVQTVHTLLDQTQAHLLSDDFETAVEWLSHPRHRIWLIGGYITGPLAEYFCHHLQTIRPNVALLRPIPYTWVDTLVDMNKNDVLVLFDIRRYWSDMRLLSQTAAERKCRQILITDQWTSPLSRFANLTLTAYTEGKSGWDINVALLLLIDALIAALNNLNWEATKNRLEQVERLRQNFHLDN